MTSKHISTLVIAKPRNSFMCAAPVRPGKVVGKLEREFAYEAKEKPPNFGSAQGQQNREIRKHMRVTRASCFWF